MNLDPQRVAGRRIAGMLRAAITTGAGGQRSQQVDLGEKFEIVAGANRAGFHEILVRQSGVKREWSYFLAVTGILAFSAFYEVLEGIAAMIVSPELGTAYLGTQGDEWDAQKDSFLALSGAITAMLVTWWRVRK